jgi:hypothetical protein
MIYNLTKELFQSYSNESEIVRVDILFNNTFDFFYCEIYENGVLAQDTTRITNNYENNFVKFSSLTADFASFDLAESFTIEVKND